MSSTIEVEIKLSKNPAQQDLASFIKSIESITAEMKEAEGGLKGFSSGFKDAAESVKDLREIYKEVEELDKHFKKTFLTTKHKWKEVGKDIKDGLKDGLKELKNLPKTLSELEFSADKMGKAIKGGWKSLTSAGSSLAKNHPALVLTAAFEGVNQSIEAIKEGYAWLKAHNQSVVSNKNFVSSLDNYKSNVLADIEAKEKAGTLSSDDARRLRNFIEAKSKLGAEETDRALRIASGKLTQQNGELIKQQQKAAADVLVQQAVDKINAAAEDNARSEQLHREQLQLDQDYAEQKIDLEQYTKERLLNVRQQANIEIQRLNRAQADDSAQEKARIAGETQVILERLKTTEFEIERDHQSRKKEQEEKARQEANQRQQEALDKAEKLAEQLNELTDEEGRIRTSAHQKGEAAAEKQRQKLAEILKALEAIKSTYPALEGLDEQILKAKQALVAPAAPPPSAPQSGSADSAPSVAGGNLASPGVAAGSASTGAQDAHSQIPAMIQQVEELDNKWKGLGTSVSDVLNNGIKSAVQGVSDSIMGAIEGTATWGQTFAKIGRQIISNLIQIFTQWIIQELILDNVQELLSTKKKTRAISEAGAKAPNALMDSISSWGVAAAVGVAALIAAMAAIGGFAQGGLIGGGEQLIRVNERGPEFVIPAQRVNEFGAGFFEASVHALFEGSLANSFCCRAWKRAASILMDAI
ncbi:MAG: hypothetical protein AB1705_22595 [Verrucomicrobiota bacterium]